MGTPDQIVQLRSMLNDGTLVSGLSSVDVRTAADTAAVNNNQVHTMRSRPHSPFQGALSPLELELPPGPIVLHPTIRHLRTSYHGPKPILAVKVIDVNGLQHPDSPAVISDKLFGTYGDEYTMTSQFGACSFDKLQIVPAFQKSRKLSKHLSDVGVMEVELSISLKDSSQYWIRREVKRAMEDKLGFGLPGGEVEHVMVILEGCYVDCGW